MKRQAILVLGVHRSGTSALTGAIVRLGVKGPEHLIPGDKNNPTGYWESGAFNAFHERLLRSAGSEWHDWTTFNPEWFRSPAAVDCSAEFRTLLNQEFEAAPLFVVKDPRICRFVPFWTKNLESEQVATAAIVVLRSPLEVAGSLRARDGFGLDRSLLIWLRHVLDAEFATRALRRSFVRYDDLLDDWRTVADRIATDIGVTWPERSRFDGVDEASIVKRELRHHVMGVEAIDAASPLSDWVVRTWRALELLCEPGFSQLAEVFKSLDEVRGEFDVATSIFGAVLHEERTEHGRLAADLNHELQRLRESLQARHLEAERLVEERNTLVQEVERARSAADAAAIENARLNTRLAAAASDCERLQNELDAAEAGAQAVQRQMAGLAIELGGTQDRVDALLMSGSWRVTAPLRAVFRVLMGRSS